MQFKLVSKDGNGSKSLTLSLSPFVDGVKFKFTSWAFAKACDDQGKELVGAQLCPVFLTNIEVRNSEREKLVYDEAYTNASGTEAQKKKAAQTAVQNMPKEFEMFFLSTLRKKKVLADNSIIKPNGTLTQLFEDYLKSHRGENDEMILNGFLNLVKDKTIVTKRTSYVGKTINGFIVPRSIAEFDIE